jgi:type I restriction enzyme S subunit
MKWDNVKLGTIAKIDWGNTNLTKSCYVKKGKYLAVSATGPDGLIDYYEHEDDTTVISAIGANCGKVFFPSKKFTAIKNTMTVKPNPSRIHKKYLYWALSKSRFNIRGAGQPFLSKSDTEKLDIPLPPLQIQEQIADTLDKADALHRKDQELLAKYDKLAQSIFYDMFGDPVKNEMDWPLKTIQQLVIKSRHSIKRGPFGGALKKEIFVDKGYLVFEQYHALNNDFSFERYYITQEKYDELIAFNVEPGDIIISCSGVYLGKLAIVPKGVKKGIINQALLKVTLDQSIYKNDFFVTVFSHPNFKEKYFAADRGAAIPNFPPMSVFKEFKFISPPLALQEKYMQITKKIKVSKTNLDNQPILFETLMNKYFS